MFKCMKTFFLLLDAVVSEDGFGLLQQESFKKTRKKENTNDEI